MIQRLALSGRFFAGKDYVAEQCGFQIESFAMPIYMLTEWFFGTTDKKIPDIRKFMQQVGQIGWGHHDQGDFRYTLDRANLIGFIREQGSRITQLPEYDWRRFGLVKTFWVDGLIRRVKNSKAKIAVTNARFEHELTPLREAGFEHYLVACSQDTRGKRYGGIIPLHLDADPSEQLAGELEKTLPPERIIWNDDLPTSKPYLSVEQFRLLC